MCFDHIKVVTSAVKSDHKAVIAYTGPTITSLNKTSTVRTYRMRSPSQHASFLSFARMMFYTVNKDNDVQSEFDRFYSMAMSLLDQFYPEKSVTITSADPEYVSPAVKTMLRKKNRLMRSGRVHEAEALARRIGAAIIRFNCTELSRLDAVTDPSAMWDKVRQLTGRTRTRTRPTHDELSPVSAQTLNEHYALISTDASYQPPQRKLTAHHHVATMDITEEEIFEILDKLKPTASGMDNLPAWFLRLAAPIFAAPIADLFNMSLAASHVPLQWKTAVVKPVLKQKHSSATDPNDYRPISVTPILSRVLERIVVRDFIYPALQHPPTQLDFTDQFAFRPLGSTTAALVALLQTITTMLTTNKYVIVYCLDFSKAFDSVRHSTLFNKYADLDLPDHIYNWLESFFHNRSHCTQFGLQFSDVLSITASIVQGSALGPVSYVVTASDLKPLNSSNVTLKYADDTYLIIPASSHSTCLSEIQNLEAWADRNNLKLNRKKSCEIVFIRPKSNRHTEIPPPAVPGFDRVQHITALGVTLSYNFSMAKHIDTVMSSCARTLYGLRTLRAHGMPQAASQLVFRSVALAKLLYAAPAWWGFVNAGDRNRLEGFLRRAQKAGYYNNDSLPTVAAHCDQADEQLFSSLKYCHIHPLRQFLPPERKTPYSTRSRPHNYYLPQKLTSLDECNYMFRVLYKDCF